MPRPLQVGIIGASASGGWARESHVPAVRHLAGLELAAVATTSQPSADDAARAFGAPAAYGDPADLFDDPAIDLVTVAAPVPAHRELILGALRAGKHVYSEWPLGAGIEQTTEIAAAARRAGVHTAIGLQALMHPVTAAARRLLESGAIGRPLTASASSTTAGFGPALPEAQLYLEQPESGMNLVTIQTAHTLDYMTSLLGPLDSLSALLTTQYPDLQVGEQRTPHHRTVADHVLVQARGQDGRAVSVEVAGGRPAGDTPFRVDIVGERGTLGVRGGAARGFQAGRLTLLRDHQPHEVDLGELAPLDEPVTNVAAVYAALRDDIANDTSTAADFDHAVDLAHLVEAVLESDARRQRVAAFAS